MIVRTCRPKSFCTVCSRVSSSFVPYKPNVQPPKEQEPAPSSILKRMGKRLKKRFWDNDEKEGWLLGKGPRAPLNFSYPNQKGVEGFEIKLSLEDMQRELPGYVKDNFQKLGREIVDRVCIDNPQALDSTIGPLHNQASIEYHFKDDKQLKRWQVGCDSVWGEGFSTCSLVRTESNTALFSGNLSTRLIQDGKIERAGWASIKSADCLAFNRKRYLQHWMNYSHLLIKCRGDGRSYKIMLHTPWYIDMTWFDSYSYPLHTHGGPYWQYERIPFSRFFLTVGGRIQDIQVQVPAFFISNVSIVLMDRVDGPFKLEVDYIGVVNDTTHEEDFAYEKYSLPVYTVVGI